MVVIVVEQDYTCTSLSSLWAQVSCSRRRRSCPCAFIRPALLLVLLLTTTTTTTANPTARQYEQTEYKTPINTMGSAKHTPKSNLQPMQWEIPIAVPSPPK